MPKPPARRRNPSTPKRRRRAPSPPLSPLDRLIDQLTDKAMGVLEDVLDSWQRNNPLDSRPGPQRPPVGPTPPPPRQPRGERPRTTRDISLYEILQVHPKADQETITAAWKSLSKRYHPDNQTTGNAAKMREINAAYQVLNNPQMRQAYDRGF